MNQETQPHPISPTTDVEKVIIKMSKDIEFLKDKVTELESEKLAEHFRMTPSDVKEQFMTDPPSKAGWARGHRPILESEIREALQHVDCAAAVARYLRISYKTYKKYATRYNLFKANPKGRGVKKKEYSVNVGKWPLDKVLAGEIYHPRAHKLKQLLLRSGKKANLCERCGWKEGRQDGVRPLVINFVDGDPTHQTLDNIKLYCHNCTFVLRGYIRRGIVVFPEVTL